MASSTVGRVQPELMLVEQLFSVARLLEASVFPVHAELMKLVELAKLSFLPPFLVMMSLNLSTFFFCFSKLVIWVAM